MESRRALFMSAGVLVTVFGMSFSAVGFDFVNMLFETTIDVNPSVATFAPGLTSELTLLAYIPTSEFRMESTFTEDGWIDQVFGFRGELESAVLTGEIDFDPKIPTLDQANLLFEMNIYGVTLEAGLTVEPGASGFMGQLTGQDALGTTYGFALLFNVDDYGRLVQTGCHTRFTGARISMSGQGIACCPDTSWRARLALSDTGFDSLRLEALLPEIPTLPWLSIQSVLTFTMDEKTLDLYLRPEVFQVDCFTFYASFSYGQTSREIASIDLEYLKLECDIGSVHFRGETIFDGSIPAVTYLRQWTSNLSGDYFEVYRIWTEQDGCCGPLGFEVVAYFAEDGIRLFDLAAVQAHVLLETSAMSQIGTGMEFDFEQPVGDQWVYWDVYFRVMF